MTDVSSPNPAPASATLDCPSCGHTITYYDVTGSSYYGCPNCHSYFQYENEGPPKILMRFPKQGKEAVLSIGAEGCIGGQLVRVVGYMHRKDQEASYNWREYMLLRADGTYAQLAEYDGHWTYIVPINKMYKQHGISSKAFYVDTATRQYRLYNRYKANVLLALGEFDWNVLDDEELTVAEYINPPYMLVAEHTQSNTQGWYEGEYQSPEQVATAFGLTPADLPGKAGTGAIEPPYSREKWNTILAFTGMAMAVLFGLQLLFMIVKPRSVVLNTNYTTTLETGAVANQFKPVVTKSFQINGPAALEIDLSAQIDNQWVELPVSLVNETTGQSYEFTKALEYYHGYEGGESWSEGSTSEEAELARIPSGRYHVNLYPIAEGKQEVTGTVKITQNPMLFSNLLIVALSLLIYPFYLYLKRQAMETSRWQNSDFADD